MNDLFKLMDLILEVEDDDLASQLETVLGRQLYEVKNTTFSQFMEKYNASKNRLSKLSSGNYWKANAQR